MRSRSSRAPLGVTDKHVARGGGGRGLAAIDGDQASVGQADKDEAPAADAGVVAVDDVEHERGGDGGVDGVAAARHGVERRPRGQGINGRHRGAQRRPVRRPQRGAAAK